MPQSDRPEPAATSVAHSHVPNFFDEIGQAPPGAVERQTVAIMKEKSAGAAGENTLPAAREDAAAGEGLWVGSPFNRGEFTGREVPDIAQSGSSQSTGMDNHDQNFNLKILDNGAKTWERDR